MRKILAASMSCLLFLTALGSLAGCASRAHSSEREWAVAECGQIIAEDARKKCLERVDSDYGR